MRIVQFLLLAGFAASAVGTPAAAAYIRIVGGAQSSAVESIPGLEDQGYYDLTAAGGQLVDGVVVDGGGRIGEAGYAGGQSVASAEFGRLSALGGAVAVGPPPALPASGLSASGFTQAMWVDEVTLMPNDPALLFTPARFRFEVFLSGDGGIVRTTLANQGFGNAEYSASVEVGSCPVGCQFTRVGYWNSTSPTGFDGDALPQALTGEAGVSLGSPFVLRVSIAANATVSVGGDGSVEAFSDLRNTVLWNGATVTDATGAPIAFQMQSTSGTDWSLPYTAPVPEPANAMLVLTGIAMLALAAKCRERRAMR